MDPSVLAALTAGPGTAATPGHAYRVMDYLGPAVLLAEAGYLEEAAAKFRALGPVDTWRTPLYYRLPLYALGVLVGIRVGDADGSGPCGNSYRHTTVSTWSPAPR